MNHDDVPEDDMTNHELTEDQLGAMLEGSLDSATVDHPVVAVFETTKATLRSIEAPAPSAALGEFVGVDPVIQPIELVTARLTAESSINEVMLDKATVPRRRKTMIPALTAFIGTTIGKVALGGSVAFAATAGAHATGIVDVPGLPQQEVSVVDSIDDDSSDDGTTSTTAPATIVAAADDDVSAGSTPSTVVSSDSSTSTSTTVVNSTSSTVVSGQGMLISVPVADVGVVDVSLSGGGPLPVASSAVDGWTVRPDDSDEPGEIELIFSDGSNRIDFSFEYDDGFGRARIRDRAAGTERFLWYSLADGSLVREDTSDDDSDSDDSDDDRDDEDEDYLDDDSDSDDSDDEDEDDLDDDSDSDDHDDDFEDDDDSEDD